MNTKPSTFNARQLAFKELVVGTLIYAAVLSFFDDYSSIVTATSFSTIFLAAAVLELLTWGAFLLKGSIVRHFKGHPHPSRKVIMAFGVWLVLFLSKFVFIWVVDFLFGSNIDIHGFFGILIIVACVTIAHRLADRIFVRLGD